MTRTPAERVEAVQRDNAVLLAAVLAMAEDELRRCHIAMMTLAMDAASPESLPQA